jgi:hypothetical protein
MKTTALHGRILKGVAVAAALASVTTLGAPLHAAQAPAQAAAPAAAGARVPDFSGVWRTINPPAAPREGTTLRWLPAPGELPPYTPAYQARFQKVQDSRESGSEETEPVARCLPPGMPYFMLAQYGLEIVQGKDKIALFSEWMDTYRRIFLDGRAMPKDLDPSYSGYSTGKWEGDTLVVDTVNLRDDTVLDRYGSPHSDAMKIVERIRLKDPETLEDQMTITDPKAFTKPWVVTHAYRRQKPGGNDELHDNTCTEGLRLAPR